MLLFETILLKLFIFSGYLAIFNLYVYALWR